MSMIMVAVLCFASGASLVGWMSYEAQKPWPERCEELSPFDQGRCFKAKGHRYPHEARATGTMAIQGFTNHWWSSREKTS